MDHVTFPVPKPPKRPNVFRRFFTRHPFIKNLVKLSAYLTVGYHTLALAALAPLLVILIIGLAASGGGSATGTPNFTTVFGTGSNQLLSIPVSGMIVGENSTGGSWLNSLDGMTSGYDVKKQLYAAADNSLIKGVILEINSPGGTIYGAHAIADGVKYYRDHTKQPVYAHISGLGASGAYWAAVSTDKILADYGSDAGSIGVIMGPFEYYDKVVAEDGGILGAGVVTQNGIEHFSITAGKSKDLGSPYRKLTNDEIATLQKQVNNDYDLFVEFVSQRRGIAADVIRGQIGALTYDNKSAQDLKLIDGTANREDAYASLATAAKVDNDFSVVREDAPVNLFASMMGVITGKPASKVSGNDAAAQKAALLCGAAKSVLAYDGDTASLCQ